MSYIISILIQFLIIVVSAIYTLYTFKQYKIAKNQFKSLDRQYEFELNKDSYIIEKYCEKNYKSVYEKVMNKNG